MLLQVRSLGEKEKTGMNVGGFKSLRNLVATKIVQEETEGLAF